MNNNMVEYIAEKISQITRKHFSENLDISVIMPTSATEYYPTFAISATQLSSAGDGEPKTIVRII
jgi:hypothetical protein